MNKNNLILLIAVIVGGLAVTAGFFIYTVKSASPQATKLFIPKSSKTDETPISSNNLISVILLEKNILVYNNREMKEGELIGCKELGNKLETAKKKYGNGFYIIIKPTAGAGYKTIVDALDEMTTHKIQKYALAEPTAEEINFCNQIK